MTLKEAEALLEAKEREWIAQWSVTLAIVGTCEIFFFA